MSVSIKRQLDDELCLGVSGDFGFETARELLLLSRQCWKGGGSLGVELDDVTGVNSCAVGALMLLHEMVGSGGHFDVRVNNCAADVQRLFDSGVLDRYFR